MIKLIKMYQRIVSIPLGGLGSRFKTMGYQMPKPLVNVMGKPIICWLIDSLNLKNTDLVYIPYNKELSKYRFEDFLTNHYNKLNFKFYQLDQDTRGCAETIQISLNNLNLDYDLPIISIDGDNFCTVDFLSLWKGENKVFYFEDDSETPVFSYVQTEGDIITDIKEKDKISNKACCGIYAFDSYQKLLQACNYIISNNIRDKEEFYMSTVIGKMIQNKDIFISGKIPRNSHHCLGTPFHVRIFCNSYPRICAVTNKPLLKNKRYCFDLDNTLVTFPKIYGDYTSVEPITKNIEALRYLKKLGNTIIIYTARRMKTHNGNTGAVLADVGKLTFETLEKFNIPYDEIHFGKPQADVYIDDLALSSFEDLEKSLGFYISNIDPREFNKLESKSIEIIKKSSSKSLEGEINYYKNINPSLKDLFPIFFNYDSENFKWYEIEKIDGVVLSKLFVSQELTKEMLRNILNSVHRIHSFKVDVSKNAYTKENYINKLEERYETFDYSIYDTEIRKTKLIYDEIDKGLQNYEKNVKHHQSIIHGDPVFTNILINKYNKIKFIDMRGKIGEEITLYGDPFYDYAKIYQSLIGYDEIVNDLYLPNSYKENLIKEFWNFFNSKYPEENNDYIKLITKSLLFTLIPLHNNDNCFKFMKLVEV